MLVDGYHEAQVRENQGRVHLQIFDKRCIVHISIMQFVAKYSCDVSSPTVKKGLYDLLDTCTVIIARFIGATCTVIIVRYFAPRLVRRSAGIVVDIILKGNDGRKILRRRSVRAQIFNYDDLSSF